MLIIKCIEKNLICNKITLFLKQLGNCQKMMLEYQG